MSSSIASFLSPLRRATSWLRPLIVLHLLVLGSLLWSPDGTRYTFGSPNWGNGVAYVRNTGTCNQQTREAHLTEVLDTHGNKIVITYATETRNIYCPGGSAQPYVRAIRPTNIEYFPSSQTNATVRVDFTYVTQWSYDSADRVTLMVYPGGEGVNSVYNTQGLLTRLYTTGLDYVQSTTYDVAGRMTQQVLGNPTVLQAGYSYVLNNPLRYVDSSGHIAIDSWGGGGGGGGGIAVLMAISGLAQRVGQQVQSLTAST